MTQDRILTSNIIFKQYIDDFASIIMQTVISEKFRSTLSPELTIQKILSLFLHCKDKNGTVYIIGNGGSAAIASHATIDFLNMVKMKAMAMLDAATTTCISNDYGYEQVYAKQLMSFVQNSDVLIAISSSGRSKNIINAVSIAKNRGANVITLSGFSEDNPLRQAGDYNIWLNSQDYGQVEIGHAFILHYLTDCLRDMVCAMEKELAMI